MFWLWLVLIQLIVFTSLVFFLRMILTRNISTATAHLHELNQDYNVKVEDANKRKAEVDRYYDEMLLKAKADAEKNKVAILREAQATQELVVNQARQQSEEIIGQANRAHEMAMNEIEARVEARAGSRACEIVSEVLTAEMSETLHKQWVKELLKTGLSDVERLHIPDDVHDVPVATAFELTEEHKSQLVKKLKEALGRDVTVTETLKPELVAGVQIMLGSLVIDGSLQHKVKEAARNGHHG